jgi:hypothetical protein
MAILFKREGPKGRSQSGPVIPAKAGIFLRSEQEDSGFRRNDGGEEEASLLRGFAFKKFERVFA